MGKNIRPRFLISKQNYFPLHHTHTLARPPLLFLSFLNWVRFSFSLYTQTHKSLEFVKYHILKKLLTVKYVGRVWFFLLQFFNFPMADPVLLSFFFYCCCYYAAFLYWFFFSLFKWRMWKLIVFFFNFLILEKKNCQERITCLKSFQKCLLWLEKIISCKWCFFIFSIFHHLLNFRIFFWVFPANEKFV